MSTEIAIAMRETLEAAEPLGVDWKRAERAILPAGHAPVLLVVIDTEEEFDWSAPFGRENRDVTAIAELPRLQDMFETIGVRPTYVIDYPVATTPSSAAILRSFARAGTAEVGAHLHPWVNPPHIETVSTANSYAGNLPAGLEARKLGELTEAIEKNIGVRPVTYKAGRYGIAPHTVSALRKLGYRCDTSTSPSFNWSGDGGPDYRGYPNYPYWLAGGAPLLEIPTTGGWCGPLRGVGPHLRAVENCASPRRPNLKSLLRRTGLATRPMLSPEGYHLGELQRLTRQLIADGEQVLSLSFHSPTLAEGYTSFVRTPAERAAFFERIRSYARWFKDHVGGEFMTATELHDRVSRPRA
jgi:hypothetical protein